MALLQAVLMAWVAGLAMAVGASISWAEGVRESEAKQEWIHGIVAFGGGVLVAAVAFVLVPTGMEQLPLYGSSLCFIGGALAFMLIDRFLATRQGPMAQFMAMLMDFLPEAVAMGAVFTHHRKLGILLALFIGAQNLPEGFNAFRELIPNWKSPLRIVLVLLVLSILGPVAALVGYFFVQDHHGLLGGVMLFAGGGILYLIFQDIAPLVPMKRSWAPPLGASLGFLVGMIGHALLG